MVQTIVLIPWYQSCFNPESHSSENYRQRKLNFLKFMRDNLETRLAAINAAIETMERQNRQD